MYRCNIDPNSQDSSDVSLPITTNSEAASRIVQKTQFSMLWLKHNEVMSYSVWEDLLRSTIK